MLVQKIFLDFKKEAEDRKIVATYCIQDCAHVIN